MVFMILSLKFNNIDCKIRKSTMFTYKNQITNSLFIVEYNNLKIEKVFILAIMYMVIEKFGTYNKIKLLSYLNLKDIMNTVDIRHRINFNDIKKLEDQLYLYKVNNNNRTKIRMIN